MRDTPLAQPGCTGGPETERERASIGRRPGWATRSVLGRRYRGCCAPAAGQKHLHTQHTLIFSHGRRVLGDAAADDHTGDGSRRPTTRLAPPPDGEPGFCGVKYHCGVRGRKRHVAVPDREYIARWMLLCALPAVRPERGCGELHSAVRHI